MEVVQQEEVSYSAPIHFSPEAGVEAPSLIHPIKIAEVDYGMASLNLDPQKEEELLKMEVDEVQGGGPKLGHLTLKLSRWYWRGSP